MTLREQFEREMVLMIEGGLQDSDLRRSYEKSVRRLKEQGEALLQKGIPEHQVARSLHAQRRELGEIYKEAALPLFRQYIYYATEKKYGDPLGPNYEMLRERKTDREIIESACRPIEDLSHRLTLEGFRLWFDAVWEPAHCATSPAILS